MRLDHWRFELHSNFCGTGFVNHFEGFKELRGIRKGPAPIIYTDVPGGTVPPVLILTQLYIVWNIDAV